MDWNSVILQVIDIRSFSSIWYWIMTAVLWSSVSYWVLGVPFDMISRARRQGGQVQEDMIDLVRINITRLLSIAQAAGLVMIGVVFFVLTMLMMLGFWYRFELAQALALMLLPLAVVGAVSLSTANMIRAADPEPEALYKMLLRHRLWVQIIGMIAIFIAAMYGMSYNLTAIRGL